MKRWRLGLVVGKFSPLHKGHEWLIDTALEQCDVVRVISYAKPSLPQCEPTVRRAWLEHRFPNARILVVDDQTLALRPDAPRWPPDAASPLEHRRFVGYLCNDLLGERVDVVFTSEAYGPGFAAELDLYQREHGVYRNDDASVNARVAHVAVDPERVRLPVSGTRVRQDPHGSRQFLSPHVYAHFVERVAVLGGESSGKSTLVLALAKRFHTSYVTEYGRTLWEAKGGVLTQADLLAIAVRQLEFEHRAADRARRYLFCDTSPLTTRLYSEWMFGRADERLITLAATPYAFTVLCAPDIPFHQDGTRRDAAFRQQQHERYVQELEQRGVPYVLVQGSVANRVEAVIAALALPCA